MLKMDKIRPFYFILLMEVLGIGLYDSNEPLINHILKIILQYWLSDTHGEMHYNTSYQITILVTGYPRKGTL